MLHLFLHRITVASPFLTYLICKKEPSFSSLLFVNHINS
jgi:hypothetical protein